MPQTFVVHWSEVFVDADRGRALEPMPRHILQELYSRDKQAFANSAYWHSEFVGLGPYRMTNWERGSHVEMSRFDDYFLGRPPLDAIIARFISDPNTVVAGLLAGTIDVATDQSDVGTDPALEVRRRWEGTGNQVRFDLNGGMMALEIQYRDEFARPRNGFTNRVVRQAFYQALDRPFLAEVITEGLSPVADSWYPPIHPQRREIESAIPQFPYDPARALQLLAEVGWVRGSDGLLTNQQTGERFETELWSTSSYGDPLTRANAIIDYWKAIGAPVAPYAVPAAVDSDRERMAKRPGPLTVGAQGKTYEETRLHSKFVPVESTRWTGINRGGYSNPRADAILDRLTATVAPGDRVQLHRELLQEQMGDLAVMPLWWNMVPTLTAKGVKGVRLVPTAATLSSFDWDRD